MYILLLVLVVVGALVAFLYNSLVRLRNKVKEAWADIDTQLKRRYDLIPNIVETVKGYASHESGTFEKVVQARTAAMNAQSVQDKEQAENMLSSTLKSIFALAENYPELKANQNFMQLQQTLKEIEEALQLARRYYNGTVKYFNNKIKVFTKNLMAGPLGFKAEEFFQATDEEKDNVKVSFDKEEKQAEPAPMVDAEVEGTPEEAPAAPEAVPEPEPTPAAPEAVPEPEPTPEPVIEASAEPAPAAPAPEPEKTPEPEAPATPAVPTEPAPEAPVEEEKPQ